LQFEMMNISASVIQKQAVAEIEKCNEETRQYGLVLSHTEAIELVETRALSLADQGRIEFGGGIINKIIESFCDSPFISMHNYTETLHELVEIFYYYKNETLDLMRDDDLLKFMKKYFNGKCQGSLALLSGREMARMARNLRFGYPADYSEEEQSAMRDFDGRY
jgi:hypothetical protein